MFSNRLQEARKAKNLTQQEMANRLGVTKSAYGFYEQGRSTPDVITAKQIASILDVSVDYLLGNSEELNRRHEIRRSNDAIRIPVLGSVAAGIPLEAIEDTSDWEEIPASMAAGGETFIALTIHGTSMEPRMREGDVVIIRLQDDVDSGDIALVYVNGDDATCKMVNKTEKGIWLKGLNDSFYPMFYSWDEVNDVPVRIAGKVVELRAKF